ncbi:MAG: acetyltransferase [Cyclobacteriaceae bacterium]|nr:MAG: acetyltransferase [Cyclobacteriaceae bacterium]
MILRWISYLPLSVLYGVATLLYFVTFYVVRYRFRVVKTNLQNAFPGRSDSEINKIMKEFYRNFSDFIIEALKSLTISAKQLNSRVIIKDPEVIEKYFNNGQSVLVLTSHQFNWEWLLLASSIKLSAPLSPVYKQLNNKYFNNLMLKARSRFGSKPIEMQQTLVEIVNRKDKVNAFGLVADQTPMVDADKYWSSFLNQDTAFYVGTERIAYLTRYPVLFVGMKKIKRGHYQIKFEELAEPPYSKNDHFILDRYIAKTEELIQASPAEWLWSHRRWKYQKPFYTD